MTRKAMWAGAVAVILLAAGQASRGEEPSPLADVRSIPETILWIDHAMQTAIAKRRASGIAVALVKDGQIVFKKGYGQADVAGRQPVDPDTTRFSLASITKSFTATAIAQLLESGRIKSLDDAANQYLVRIKLQRYEDREVTIRNLLDHRAGFDESIFGLATTDNKVAVPSTPAEIKERLPRQVRRPGDVSVYSNAGYGVLGVVIEDITGQSLDQYLNEHVLTPLGMTRSSLSYRLEEGVPAAQHQGQPLELLKDGTSRAIPLGWMYHPFITPSAGLISTASDMAQFMAGHLAAERGDAPHLLSPDLARQMHARGAANHPAVSAFGMSFFVQTQNGSRIVENAGSGPGFQSTLLLLPDQNLGFVALIMGESDDTVSMFEVRQAFLDEFLGPMQKTADTSEKPPIAQFVGLYRNERRPHVTVEALLNPGNMLRVDRDGPDSVKINGEAGYHQIARGVLWKPGIMPFVKGEASSDLYAFELGEDGEVRYAAPRLGMDVFLPVVIDPTWMQLAAVVLLVLCVSGAGARLWHGSSKSERRARRTAIVLGVAAILIAATIAFGVFGIGNLPVYIALGHTAFFWVLAALTSLVAVLGVIMAVCVIAWWRERSQTVGDRGRGGLIHASLLAAAALGLLPVFAYFNLLGFRIFGMN